MSVSLKTNHGTIKIELFCEKAPESSKNFLALAASGGYDNTVFHRSIKGFIVQGGDPSGTGKGGVAWTGEMLESEPSALRLKHSKRGTVSLAITPGKAKSVGSQFFITYDCQPSLDGQYPVIGHVIDGLETLNCIEEEAVSEKRCRPLNDVVIESIHIHANPLAD
jgi:peptidyl-prolyl cis-trans isomerase-like 3